jgi:hypothetical protein
MPRGANKTLPSSIHHCADSHQPAPQRLAFNLPPRTHKSPSSCMLRAGAVGVGSQATGIFRPDGYSRAAASASQRTAALWRLTAARVAAQRLVASTGELALAVWGGLATASPRADLQH